MTTKVLRSPTKVSTFLVVFRYGDPSDPSYARYTDDLQDYVQADGTTFTSLPAMDISLGRISGTLEDGDTEIKLKVSDEFLSRLISGAPHSRVSVRILEVLKTDGQELVLVQFSGTVWSVTKNHQGVKGNGLIVCRSWKSFLDIPLSFTIQGRCPWTFGDDNCKFHVRDKGETGTVTKIDGLRITISGLDSHPKYWWKKGYIEQDGLRIPIKNWSGNKVFLVTKVPPADWVDSEVQVYPGCDKKYVTCGKWGQTNRFGGIGKKMPTHHTVYEGGD